MSGGDPHLALLSTLARALASAPDPAAVYPALAESAVRALEATAARVWVDDPKAGVLVAVGSFGIRPEVERSLLTATSLPYGLGVPGSIFVTRAAEFIPDASGDPRWVNREYMRTLGLRGYAGLPLRAGNLVVGVLSVLFDRVRLFDERERLLAGVLADYAAIAVRVAQLYEARRRADALHAVNQLATAAAHEMNNPLAVVLGNLDLLAARVADRPEALARLQRVQQAARRLEDVVKRMHRIVRVETSEAGGAELPPMLDLRRSSGETP